MKWRLNFPEWLKTRSTTTAPALPVSWRQEHAEAKINILKQGIEDALHFFKTFYAKHTSRSKLPWVLLLGTEGAGKTSLLAMSNLGITSIDNQLLQQPNPTAYCDWWFAKDAVLIDVAGSLMMPEDPKSDSHHIWGRFIHLLANYRKRNTLNSLVLCIDLYEFLNKTRGQRQLQIDIFRHRIQTLTKFISHLPVYLLFTKCDQITGFTDSFNALSPEDCMQPFGISLSYGISQQNFTQQLDRQFSAFLRRLNEQLISRLHREHNFEKRGNIKNFPLQLESQKRDILHLAAQLHSTKTSLSGIYFTSSLQDGKNANALNHLSSNFGLTALTNIEAIEYPPQKRAFFIEQTLQKIIDKKIIYARNIPAFLVQNSKQFYLALAALLLIGATCIVPAYLLNRAALNDTQIVLKKFQPSPVTAVDSKNPLAGLATLNALQRALNDSKSHHSFLTFVFPQANKLQSYVNARYQNALKLQFSPMVKQSLESQLRNGYNILPQQLFSTLKLYLMLSDSSHLNKDFVIAWFTKYWHESLPDNPMVQSQLLSHLSAWLNQSPIFFQSDADMVKLARQTLSSLPLSELVYLALQENYEETSGNKVDTPSISNAYFSLPLTGLYTAAHFDNIYQQEIPELAKRVATGDDWVLNLQLPTNLTGNLIEQLTENVRKLYVQRYLAYWQLQLLNMQVGKFKNLAQAEQLASTFSSENSPLFALINMAESNLIPVANFPDARDVLIEAQQLRDVLEKSLNLLALQKNLKELSSYLHTISQAEDTGEASLKAAQSRMRNPGKDPISTLSVAAKSLPEPLNKWVGSLAINSWRNLLLNSQNYLNLRWIAEVVPVYNEHIKNHYPVFNNSSKEMSLKEFADFFGPNGTMDNFFKQNLAAFADTNQLYWQWKYQDGERLNVSQSALEMFNRAALIRQMYFPGNQKNPSVLFALSPTATKLLSENYNLNLDGQNINYSRDFRQQKKIMWPGPNQGYASLEWSRGNENKTIWKITGPWAVFRLLANANLKAVGNTESYHLTFTVNGLVIPYDLIAAQAINPFIPNILNGFRSMDRL